MTMIRMIILILFLVIISIQTCYSFTSFDYLNPSDSSKIIDKKTSTKKTKKKISEDNSYLFLGVSFNSLGNASLVLGIQTDFIGIRFEPGINEKNRTIHNISSPFFQLNFMFNIYDKHHITQNLSLGTGNYYEKPSQKFFYGIFYDINIYGLFFEGGYLINAEEGYYKLGYVYRFND